MENKKEEKSTGEEKKESHSPICGSLGAVLYPINYKCAGNGGLTTPEIPAGWESNFSPN